MISAWLVWDDNKSYRPDLVALFLNYDKARHFVMKDYLDDLSDEDIEESEDGMYFYYTTPFSSEREIRIQRMELR